jgi:apolipoprotein N-acyltransferase
VLLAWALHGLTAGKKLALAALWGILFEAAFYHWVGGYGPLPWGVLSLVRGLPWALYPLPALLLEAAMAGGRFADRRGEGEPPALSWAEILGGALGLALVSQALLWGLTGVDWETPAGALTAWPWMLAPLRRLGLGGVALMIGLVSHLLGSWRPRAALAGALALLAWMGLALALPLSAERQPPLPVALVQTGFTQAQKWDESRRKASVDRLLADTEQAAQAGARLVIWPETAWPYRGMRHRPTSTHKIGKTARRLGVDILASSIEDIPGRPDWWNSASLVLASGRFSGHYEKRRLAPFAEYLPLPAAVSERLRQVRPFSGISRFVSGRQSTVFSTSAGQRFAVLICYESMTPAMACEMAPRVDFLVVITNDAPFAHAQANEAHFRSAILRAIETGKPVLQAANTGVTGAVRGDGTVWLRTPTGFSGPSVQYLLPRRP